MNFIKAGEIPTISSFNLTRHFVLINIATLNFDFQIIVILDHLHSIWIISKEFHFHIAIWNKFCRIIHAQIELPLHIAKAKPNPKLREGGIIFKLKNNKDKGSRHLSWTWPSLGLLYSKEPPWKQGFKCKEVPSLLYWLQKYFLQ